MKIYHPSDGIQERVAAVRWKLQSGGNPGRDRSLVGVDERIRKPPGARHDGHAAVAQPIELRQSTWLEPRGNKDCIASALHQMRQSLVIADDHAIPAPVPRGGSKQRALQSRIAGAENSQAGTSV